VNKRKDLEYFMKLNYNVILKKRNELFFLYIPELSLIVEKNNLDEAYEELEKEKEIYIKNALDLDAQDTIEEPVPIKLRKSLVANFLPFFIKLFIVIFIVSIFSLPIVRFVGYQLGQMRGNAVRFMWHLPERINNKLKNMSVEKKEEKLIEIRGVIEQIKPFVEEFRVLLIDIPEKGSETHIEKND